MVTNPAILLVINAVRVFPSLPTGTVPLERAALLPIFVNSFRFAGWTVFLSKSFESELSRLINYLSSSLTQIALFSCKKKRNGFEMNFGSKYVIK